LPRRGLRLVVAARGGIGSVRTGFFCRQRHAGIFGELVFKLAALSGEGLAKVALGLLKLSRSLGFILIARTAAWPFWLRLWTCESIAPGSTTNPAPPVSLARRDLAGSDRLHQSVANENVSVIHNSIGQNNHTGEDLHLPLSRFPVALGRPACGSFAS
jgi:hypothetical protein